MDFYQGGLYSQYRDEGCFVKYMADAIQSAQLHLKNEQWDINVDFEEFISSIRRFGEPLCIWNWYNMIRDEKSGYLKTSSIGLIDWEPGACAECPFEKDKSWQKDPEILNGIKLVRDVFFHSAPAKLLDQCFGIRIAIFFQQGGDPHQAEKL